METDMVTIMAVRDMELLDMVLTIDTLYLENDWFSAMEGKTIDSNG